jgi:tRNA-specific 2-thiouridylase
MSGRVVVAMSGGVDSAVAAARCVAAGYDVVGISLRLARGGEGSCCSLDDFLDARAVADVLGFPHYVFDFTDAFEERVVAPFVADYLAGRTPNPCTRCNQHVKFDLLWQRARELGATRLATGHYARIDTDRATGLPCLRAARDATKDQSYFLFTLGAAELERTLFPIGESTKAEVRAEARRLALPIADKPESMEVCFVPGGDAAAFVAGRVPDAVRPGSIVDADGSVLGTHAGVHGFTVGQRRGLGVGGGPRRYVRAIDAASGTITVADGHAMRGRGLRATNVRWSAGAPPSPGTAVGVRIRHRHPLVAAQLTQCGPDEATVAFTGDGPVVTPGQAAVFYDEDRVLGGGWIVGELAA